ncbi:MAG: ThuA domain-containing protein [Isosphaeraceae bacterium]|nr:ThuA domain-containing protein [Isosphaeraceae bacterium]
MSRWSLPSALVLAASLGGFATPASAQKKVPDGAKILLLSGGAREHHGYRDQAFYLSSVLEDTKRFQVTIVEDAAILETSAMAKYDGLIVLTDRRDPEFKFTLPQQEALLAFVRGGKGYVSIHGADNAAPDWVDGWRDMLGGVFSHVGLPDSKTRKGTFQVKIAQRDHPVTNGVSDFEIQDELYYLLQMRGTIEPLATTEHNGQTWPVAWVREYGKGKVFHTVFGHRDFGPGKNDPLRNPGLQRLIIQGTDWVTRDRAASPSASPAK